MQLREEPAKQRLMSDRERRAEINSEEPFLQVRIKKTNAPKTKG